MCFPCCSKGLTDEAIASMQAPPQTQEDYKPEAESSTGAEAASATGPQPSQPERSASSEGAAVDGAPDAEIEPVVLPFLIDSARLKDENINRLCLEVVDFNTLDDRAKELYRNSTKVFQVFEGLTDDPSPTYLEVTELLAMCEQTHFKAKRVLDSLAEALDTPRDTLGTHVLDEDFKTHFLDTAFKELDTWAEKTLEIDLAELDKAVYDLLLPYQKLEGRDDPEYGKTMRHKSLSRWWEAVNLVVARKNDTPLPEAVRFAPPEAPGLSLGEIPAVSTRTASRIRNWYSHIHLLLTAIDEPTSTNRDIHLRLAAVGATIGRTFLPRLFQKFQRNMSIDRATAERILSAPHMRDAFRTAICENVDFHIQMYHSEIFSEEAHTKWVEDAFKVRVQAAPGDHREEFAGAIAADEEWCMKNHFHPHIPTTAYFECIFERTNFLFVEKAAREQAFLAEQEAAATAAAASADADASSTS